ncbi:hypothetical protein [Burkholderia ambifaria]|uniref:hypothetical protein n=1 Tax=Burkholderia ambifaria TaxID=152480 RepID=UPI00158AA34B|nr:hypothetical protein [Burkholderia ambifaria]
MKITDDMLTEWFPGTIKPARPGMYEVKREYCDGTPMPDHYLQWTGKRWEYAYAFRLGHKGDYAHLARNEKWRGLKEPQRD